MTYRADVIDTWNMTVTPIDGVLRFVARNGFELHDPGRPTITLPAKPYLALRLTRV